MLNTEYISNLPKQRIQAAAKICEDFIEGGLKENPRDIVHTLEVILGDDAPKAEQIPSSVTGILFGYLLGKTPVTDVRRRIILIHRHIKALQAREIIEGNDQLANQNLIEIDRSEIPRIEKLLSEIRDLVRNSEVLDEDHKLRLLKIVSNLQNEIDKPISSYRVFLNGMVETSEALGKSGENVKPVFDRMREIFGIADKAKKQLEEISGPEETKRLPPPEETENE